MRKYDYKKAIEIIEAEKQNLVNVYLGMYEDWFYTKPVWLELGCLSAPCQDSLPPIEKWEKNEDK